MREYVSLFVSDMVFFWSVYVFSFVQYLKSWKGKFGPFWCNQFGAKTRSILKNMFKFGCRNRRGEQNCDPKNEFETI